MGISERLGNLDPNASDAPTVLAVRTMTTIGRRNRSMEWHIVASRRPAHPRIRQSLLAGQYTGLAAFAADGNQIVRPQPINNCGGDFGRDLREFQQFASTPGAQLSKFAHDLI